MNKPLNPIILNIVVFSILFFWTIPIIIHNPLDITNITFKETSSLVEDYESKGNYSYSFQTDVIFHYVDHTTVVVNYNVVKVTSLIAVFYTIGLIYCYFKKVSLNKEDNCK
jgi:hypothetical protein